jgi:hypothetical protein
MSQTKMIVEIANVVASASVDRLEHTSYEIDSTTNVFDAIEIIKSSRKKLDEDEQEWIKIKKPELIELIAQAYFDPDKKKILNAVSDKPTNIPQILDICSLAPTNGYRKINSLIKSGLIIPVGYAIIQNRKKIKKYLAVIENVIIRLDEDTISVKVRFKKKNKTSSS